MSKTKKRGWFIAILYKYWVILKGIFILYPIIRKAMKAGQETLPAKYSVYDNDEDGYWGDKNKHESNNYLGWYSNYLGKDISKLSLNWQVWYAYRWSAFRNGAFGLRKDKDYAADMNPTTGVVKILQIEGNTDTHEYRYSHEKKRQKIWYNVVWESNNKQYVSKYRMFPVKIPFIGDRDIYVRWGWKFYPAHHIHEYWKCKISEGTFKVTTNFTFSVPSFIIRIRENMT